jgi:putative sterol carrier protein
MVEYFSEPFFGEVASRLNADAEWRKKASNVSVKIILTCVDRGRSFLIDARDGIVSSTESTPDFPADFKFEGTYDAWTMLGKGEKDLQSLVLGGKIRFRGSMPKIMALIGPLTRFTQVAQQVPKEF